MLIDEWRDMNSGEHTEVAAKNTLELDNLVAGH